MYAAPVVHWPAASRAAIAVASGREVGASPVAVASDVTTVRVRHTRLGEVLVNWRGWTLYTFAKDPRGRSTCTGECAGDWPPLTVKGTPIAGRGVCAGRLTTLRRAGGERQVVYDGHPLYTFFGDDHPGMTLGQRIDAYGARWYALTPAGVQVGR